MEKLQKFILSEVIKTWNGDSTFLYREEDSSLLSWPISHKEDFLNDYKILRWITLEDKMIPIVLKKEIES
jgi:hypothetical protein